MSKKLDDLQKRQLKLQNELNSAKIAYKKQAEGIKNKEDQLKIIEADIVSLLLVENNMSISELTSLLSKSKEESVTNNLTMDGE